MITQIKVLIIICLSLALTGCGAFRKKFVRKPKREKEVEVVIRTHEYESEYSQIEFYKRYFLFWKAAQEELINLLNTQQPNRKKRVYLSKKIMENLQHLRQFLVPEKQEILDEYISAQNKITQELDKYNFKRVQKLRIRSTLERHKRQIQKEFAHKYIQEYLITR